jgi:hypothetical protein
LPKGRQARKERILLVSPNAKTRTEPKDISNFEDEEKVGKTCLAQRRKGRKITPVPVKRQTVWIIHKSHDGGRHKSSTFF